MWIHVGYRKDGKIIVRYVQGFKALRRLVGVQA